MSYPIGLRVKLIRTVYSPELLGTELIIAGPLTVCSNPHTKEKWMGYAVNTLDGYPLKATYPFDPRRRAYIHPPHENLEPVIPDEIKAEEHEHLVDPPQPQKETIA